MHKKLKLETIVPSNLYIKRKADKQLKQIIDDMSRPASILVSRQMGKTNLLLNTKRELENKSTIFVYIDLSKIDNDIRDCFRYIIDTAIDTNINIFEDAENDIKLIREKNRLPYREHEQELLALLKRFDGKIIIILDEIDSMKKFDFSDQFFSQIRSVYYSSRTNFKEFNNLTYILSGVLEPSEIIQDNTKSPFNISEKVYLNDFTKAEFFEFIKKIKFDFFDENIIEKIYEWTHGHPRMIWNICSKLEELYLEKEILLADDVDNIIQLLYFHHSDLPPIDHIKDLLNENHEIVHILLEMKQGNFLNVTDPIKNKLYLYGIIDITNKNKIQIKNKILESILSEEYLKTVLYQSKTPFEVAYDLYSKYEYSSALNEFQKCINLEEISKEQKKYIYYYIAICLYNLGEYQLALDSFENAEFDITTDAKMYYQKELDKGICFLWLMHYNEALSQFDKVIAFKDQKTKINAYINKATVFIYDKSQAGGNEVTFNLDAAITLLESNKKDLDKEYYQETLAKAYFNKASFYSRIDKSDKAVELYKKILSIDGIERYKPNVILELIELDTLNAKKYLAQIFDIIKRNSLNLKDGHDVLTFSLSSLYQYIYNLIEYEEDDLISEVLNYCQNTYDMFKSKCDVLASCANHYLSDRKKSETINLYSLNYQKSEIGSKECYRDVYASLIYLYYRNHDYNSLKKFVNETINLMIETQDSDELNFNHYSILTIILGELLKYHDIVLARQIFQQIEQEIINKITKENIIFKAMLLDKKHDLCIDTNDKKDISQECINILEENTELLNLFSENTRNYTYSIKKKHHSFLFQNIDRKPLTNDFRIGRNDLCTCGSGKKYKKCCAKNT